MIERLRVFVVVLKSIYSALTKALQYIYRLPK